MKSSNHFSPGSVAERLRRVKVWIPAGPSDWITEVEAEISVPARRRDGAAMVDIESGSWAFTGHGG